MLEVVGSNPALAKQRIKFLGLLSLPPEWDYKRSLVSLVAQVGNQRQRRGGSPLRWRDIKLPTRLQTWRTTMTECPTRV